VSTASSIALGEIMASKSGSVDPSKFPDEVFDLYSIPAFDSGHPEVVAGKAIGSAKQVVRPGDVLLSRIVPHIRRAWVVANGSGRRIIASGEWIVFRSDRVHPDYLRHVLVGDPFHSQFMNTVAGVGGSLLRARPEHVGKIKIPLPPLPEQRRIAKVLDRAEALRTKRRATLTQLDTLTQSIFLDLFGNAAKKPGGLRRSRLEQVCESSDDIKCGPFGTQLAKSEVTTQGVPLWGIKNVNALFDLATHEFLAPKTSSRLAQYSLRPGDIVMTRKGTVGNCAVYPEYFPAGIMHSDLLRIRVDRSICEPIFLSHQLHYSKDVERQLALISGGAVMPGINVTKLKILEVDVPPLELQHDFVLRVAAIEKLKSSHRASLAELDTLFAVLQHRAFRGEL
jgi:type I restriction enzyme S subunit